MPTTSTTPHAKLRRSCWRIGKSLRFGSRHPQRPVFASVARSRTLPTARLSIATQRPRRDQLTAEVDAIVRENFAGGVLTFDSAAARAYGDIAAGRRSLGRSFLEANCQTAAIACATNATVATHNSADFEHCGITLIDPWTNSAALP